MNRIFFARFHWGNFPELPDRGQAGADGRAQPRGAECPGFALSSRVSCAQHCQGLHFLHFNAPASASFAPRAPGTFPGRSRSADVGKVSGVKACPLTRHRSLAPEGPRLWELRDALPGAVNSFFPFLFGFFFVCFRFFPLIFSVCQAKGGQTETAACQVLPTSFPQSLLTPNSSRTLYSPSRLTDTGNPL